MPSRILKESICTSESLAYLSAEAEVLFYRLIVKADDFGLYYGSPKILASLLFPLNVPTEKKVSSWLAELVNGGLVATYRAEDGRQYLKLLSWDKHQNRRATKPKYPLPQEFDNTCSQGVSSDNSDTCAQMQADSSVNVNENVFENVNEKRKRVSAQRGAGVDDTFDQFWSVYPRKVGKKDAVKVWNQIRPNPDLTNQIVQGVERWKRSEQWTTAALFHIRRHSFAVNAGTNMTAPKSYRPRSRPPSRTTTTAKTSWTTVNNHGRQHLDGRCRRYRRQR